MFTLLATTQAGNVPAATNEDAFAAGMIVMVVLTLGFWCLINWLIFDAAKAAAPEHRTMKPGLVWLMLIPLFNVFWQFKALPAVSNSLKATLDAKGQAGGDAGRLVGLLFAWIAAVHLPHDGCYHIETDLHVAGLLAGGSSQFAIAAGIGAQVAVEILSSWAGKRTHVHDTP